MGPKREKERRTRPSFCELATLVAVACPSKPRLRGRRVPFARAGERTGLLLKPRVLSRAEYREATTTLILAIDTVPCQATRHGFLRSAVPSVVTRKSSPCTRTPPPGVVRPERGRSNARLQFNSAAAHAPPGHPMITSSGAASWPCASPGAGRLRERPAGVYKLLARPTQRLSARPVRSCDTRSGSVCGYRSGLDQAEPSGQPLSGNAAPHEQRRSWCQLESRLPRPLAFTLLVVRP